MSSAIVAPCTLTIVSTMRLSLLSKLALLLAATVVLAVAVMGGGLAWNLRVGFSDYLQAQDEAWLDRFSAAAAVAVARQGPGVLSGSGSMRSLFDAVSPRRELAQRFGWADATRGPLLGGPREGPPPRRGDGPRFGRPPGPEGMSSFSMRLVLTQPDGVPLNERRMPPGVPFIERPIVVNGITVALARLVAGPPTPGVDGAFLARQYRGILFSAVGLVLVVVLGVVWLGRRWLRPLEDVQAATRRIAQGAFDVRLVPRGNDELADLAEHINAMAGALQALEASRRRWIAELSHEMRTPLAVLRGELECLADGVRPLNQAALQSLQTELMRLTRLMEDFHQLALSDLRALPCSFAPLDPAALLHAAAARFAARAAAAGLTLHCAVPAGLPAAQWDRQRVDQLLDNLLENSLRYTDAPGRVQLSCSCDGTQATLLLDDSAPGVPAADLPRLFEPLYRADASRSRRSGGSGLGLSICRAIVASHGGRITAAASPLGGLRLQIALPLQPPVPPAQGAR